MQDKAHYGKPRSCEAFMALIVSILYFVKYNLIFTSSKSLASCNILLIILISLEIIFFIDWKRGRPYTYLFYLVVSAYSDFNQYCLYIYHFGELKINEY